MQGKHISGNGRKQDFNKPAPSHRAIAYIHIAQGIFGHGNNYIEDTSRHGPMQLSSPPLLSASPHLTIPRLEVSYIEEASTEDKFIMSEEACRQCQVLFADSDNPVKLPVSRSEAEFHQGGIRAGSKRNRRNEETTAIKEAMVDVGPIGVEKSKGKIPAELHQRTAFVN